MGRLPSLLGAAAALFLAGCATRPPPASVADEWFGRIAAHCGRAYAGQLRSTDPADAAMAGQPMVMHVRQCSAEEIRIPFHVGPDRSRTWVIRRTGTGVRLKHDHRHQDGSADPLTNYGGDSYGTGTASRQQFPADQHSIALFTASGRSVSNANVWAVEIDGTTFAYELRRPPGPGERYFRVEFDLTRPIAPPPPPWGAQPGDAPAHTTPSGETR